MIPPLFGVPGAAGSAGSDMILIASSVVPAGTATMALPGGAAGDFCFVYASNNSANPNIGSGGGIVGWTTNGSTPNLGYYGYGKQLSGADVVTNQITFTATTNYQTVIQVFRLAAATTVAAKGVVGIDPSSSPELFAGFTLGGSAKEVLLVNLGQDTAVLNSPVFPPGNTDSPVTIRNFRARWGAAGLYVSGANLSYTPTPGGQILEAFKWELD